MHGGVTVRCIEVPCPKPGRPYSAGLEHAELVIGSEADGLRVRGRAAVPSHGGMGGSR